MLALSTAALVAAWEDGMGEPVVDRAPALLRSLGIQPAPEGNLEISRDVRRHLAEIRTAVFGES